VTLTAPLLLSSVHGYVNAAEGAQSVYDYSALMYEKEVSMSKYKGQVLVIVNVASEWPLQNVNYPGLRTLYDKYKGDGFALCAFSCNQFGGQAPGTSQEERDWAVRKFGFEFDVFDKIDVNGPTAHPLYKYLRSKQPRSLPSSYSRPGGDSIEWNYVKFLVDRNGQPVKRFGSAFNPADFESDVRLLLAGKPPLPEECILHPGRRVCKVDLSAWCKLSRKYAS